MDHNHIGRLHGQYLYFFGVARAYYLHDKGLIYLKSIIDEKLGHRAKRKALIRKEK
jgi:hypothetical protein